MRLVFDLEANGLLEDASLIHCLVLKNINTGEVQKFEPSKVEQGLKILMQADEVIGHNVIGYDIALASKLYPWFSIAEDKVTDTLILSRLIYADLGDLDRSDDARVEHKFAVIDSKLIGSHSLKAWGQRLKFPKDEYVGGWEQFSVEMLDYNARDVEVTERLYRLLTESKAYSVKASVLEHKVAHIVARQERYGFPFDEEAAAKLTATLLKRKAELEIELQTTFGHWTVETEFTPKVNNTKRGYVKGVPTLKKKTIVFNPGSRQHIANRLMVLRGWKPNEFTPDGKPKVDEQVLGKLPWPEAKLLTEYLMVQKRLGMLAEGDNGWTRMVRNGRIHGQVITNGAVTGRATHRNPNVAQTPSVLKDKNGNILYGSEGGYGYECRSLFTATRGRKLVGIDVSGLELRMLAFYMRDDDYTREVVSGDVHTANQKAAGLDTRNQAKTFIYAFLYGAGPEKIGSIVGKGKHAGSQLKKRFLERTPSLARLIGNVGRASTRGYLIGLDGRHLRIRSSHASLNTLLQSGGGLVCKQFLVEVDEEIERRGWRNKAQQVAWVHDEIQVDVDEDIAEEFGRMAVECIAKAGAFFNITVPLTGEYKVGNNWAETH